MMLEREIKGASAVSNLNMLRKAVQTLRKNEFWTNRVLYGPVLITVFKKSVRAVCEVRGMGRVGERDWKSVRCFFVFE